VTEELHRAVGRMEGKLEGIDAKIDGVVGMLTARDERLGKVEKRQAWWSGAAATVGAIVAVLVKH
jgi:hypothetical protein